MRGEKFDHKEIKKTFFVGKLRRQGNRRPLQIPDIIFHANSSDFPGAQYGQKFPRCAK